jgi:hypothetical protein
VKIIAETTPTNRSDFYLMKIIKKCIMTNPR